MATRTRNTRQPRPRQAQPRRHPALGRRGTVAVMVAAVGIPGLLAFAGLAVEVGNWYLIRRQAQTAADLAALAGVAVKGGQVTADAATKARNAAIGTAAVNGFDDAHADITVTVNPPPTAGTYANNANAVEVLISRTVRGQFLDAFMPGNGFTRTVSARGLALLTNTGAPCVNAKKQVRIASVSNARFENCLVQSNGTASDALLMDSSSTIEGDFSSSGGCSGSNCNDKKLTVQLNAPQLQNPFADLDSITPPNSTVLTKPANTTYDFPNNAKMTPGVYRGGSSGRFTSNGTNTLTTYKLASRSSVTLTSGTYYFHNANLALESMSTLKCEGCTFVFTGDSPAQVGTLSIKSNSSLHLTAPPLTGGDTGLGGMLFVRAGGTAGDGSNPGVEFSSNSSLHLAGGQYFGESYVKYHSNSSGGGKLCNGMVAGTVDFTSSSSVHVSLDGCQDGNYRVPRNTPQAYLVE